MIEDIIFCPHCGANGYLHSVEPPKSGYFISCESCHASVGSAEDCFDNENDAIKEWNRRTQFAAPSPTTNTSADLSELMADTEYANLSERALTILWLEFSHIQAAEWMYPSKSSREFFMTWLKTGNDEEAW